MIGTTNHLKDWYDVYNIQYKEMGHTVWATNKHYSPDKPTLLNSHHDTVRPNKAYTRDPFKPLLKTENSLDWETMMLVVLWYPFLHFYTFIQPPICLTIFYLLDLWKKKPQVLKASVVFSDLPPVDLALVGEPTLLDMAIAEKVSWFLMVQSKGLPTTQLIPMPIIRL